MLSSVNSGFRACGDRDTVILLLSARQSVMLRFVRIGYVTVTCGDRVAR